ncbi:hypothetical protein F5883DRAFT_187283 [Diaporthe sp. PMI_573]|nr:hypothetical protein F5883DRAFT_187283 [Diaporthaceae sp. PMI_573]
MDTLCSRPQPTFYSNMYSDSSVSSPYQLFSYPPANGEPVNAAFYCLDNSPSSLKPWLPGRWLSPQRTARFSTTPIPRTASSCVGMRLPGLAALRPLAPSCSRTTPNITRTVGSFHSALSQELVHNWATLPGPGSTWYVEGGADYYAAMLPFRFNIYSTDRFIWELRYLATGYFIDRHQQGYSRLEG